MTILTALASSTSTPSTQTTARVVGLDWDRDGWRASLDGLSPTKISRADLLTEDFSGFDVVIVEGAHFKERNPYSVAQVYSADELASLKFLDRVQLFPSMAGQLAKASRETGCILYEADGVTPKLDDLGRTIPDKERDSEALALYSKAHEDKRATWKRFHLPGQDPARRLWPYRDELRDDLREALNPLRAAWNAMGTAEKYALPEVADFVALLDKGFDDLPEGVIKQFGIRRSRNGIRVERMTAALTCYLAVYTRDGQLRTRPDGGFIGIRFILDTIGMSATYRPNMARSQLTHHGMRHYKGGREGGFRSEYMRNLRNLLQYLRDQDPLTEDS